jgi:hypothetical protein
MIVKSRIIFWLLIISWAPVRSQDSDTFFLHYALSKGDTIIYKRIVSYNSDSRLYSVSDFYESRQIQMKADYSSLDKLIKEDYQCNYRSNTKEGRYEEWYSNGQIKYNGYFKKGKRNGLCSAWYLNGQKQADEQWKNGQLNGRTRYWTENGELQYDFNFTHGENNNQKTVRYNYLTYLPEKYNLDSLQHWPLIIYLHGGSDRGTDLKKLYSSGIPDQIYRGRNFPFIVIAPQCPLSIRWETDNWFEPLFKEISEKYRIDPSRIYLTGYSLGGSGTWYLATKYPGRFAAIAPMSGFTSQNKYIYKHINRLKDMPVWAFHGKMDITVPYEETERLVKKLQKKNKHLKFTSEPNTGHRIHWNIYPNKDLYDWFLDQKK